MKKYKESHQHQYQLLPPNLGELIDSKHLVRVIDEFVSSLSSAVWDHAFPGGGAPSYHPQMMLKIILYAYAIKIYSCRLIARAVRQDVTFMWLAGMKKPSFNTINRFRSEYLQSVLPKVFTELLIFLKDKGYIHFSDYFIDGTKLKADAGAHSYVWKKNAQRYRACVLTRVNKLFEEIDDLNDNEDQKYGDRDILESTTESQISSEEIRAIAKQAEAHISDISCKKKQRSLNSKVSKLKEEAEKLDKYDQQNETFNGRNSYSKTDKDATFMRLKNNLLRPAYNVQISTENQFVTHYTVSQNASDSASFPDHLQKLLERGEMFLPENYVGDSGYGCEENYFLLKKNNISNYLKYSMFHWDLKGKNKKYPFHHSQFIYDQDKDVMICPAGHSLYYKETGKQKKSSGFIANIRIYESECCSSCVYKPECTKSKGNRRVVYNPLLQEYKKEAWLNLTSEKGVIFRKRRGYEPETFFGDLRHNQGFDRFSLRGLIKTDHELGLLAIAYNLRKYARIELKKHLLFINVLILSLNKLFFWKNSKNVCCHTVFA